MSDSDQTGRVGRLDARAVAKVRHDLRNPLGHIMGFGELLLERAKQQHLSEAASGLQELVAASEQILDEINHSLDPRRIANGQVDLSSLQADVQRFCRRVTALGRQAEGLMGGGVKVREDVYRITSSAERMQQLGNELAPALEASILTPSPQGSADRADLAVGTGKSEVIGLRLADEENQSRLLETLSASGYEAELLGFEAGTPLILTDRQLDVLLIELDLESDASERFLEGLKGQTATTRLPVMVLARSPSEAAVRRALRAGAQDVVRYPLQTELLLARMGSILAIKRLHDQERSLLRRIASEQQRTDQLIQTLLPEPIAARLRRGERFIADQYPDLGILSADFGGLSRWAATFPPDAVVRGLNEVFAAYDKLCQRFGVAMGRVFGDSYQVLVGVQEQAGDPLEIAAELALAMQREALPLRPAGGRLARVRIGLHGGPASGGVLGGDRLCFEVWGESVDLARVLRSQAPPGGILTSAASAALLASKYVFEPAPSLRLDDSRVLETRLLLGKA